jgi:molecular chaperone Hsp33
MLQSEQLDTRLVLAADDEVAAGLLIQRLPVEGEGNLEGGGTRNEDDIGLSRLQPHRPAGRHADARGAADAGPDTHAAPAVLGGDAARASSRSARALPARCSRERVRGMLRGLGREESDSLIAERGEVEVGCDFCGLQYRFDAVDVGEMFTPLLHVEVLLAHVGGAFERASTGSR